MRKLKILLLFLLLLGFGRTALAQGEPVTDQADLLTEAQEERLTEQFQSLREEYGCDIGVVTVNSCQGKRIQDFTDDYYYQQGYGVGEDRSGVLLAVSMGEREWYISTRGEAIRIFTDYGLGILEEEIVPLLSEGEYEKAFETFGELSGEFMAEAAAGHPYDTNHTYDRPMPLWLRAVICLAAGLVLAGIVLAVLFGQLKSVGYEKRAHPYIREGSFQVTGARDLFLYRTITSRKIERESRGGGGSSTHRTSDGGRAGGRGGSF